MLHLINSRPDVMWNEMGMLTKVHNPWLNWLVECADGTYEGGAVGAPDAMYTEVPVAFIELVPGRTVTEEEVIDFCCDQIATFKIPRYVRIIDEWPMSGTKVQKYVLRSRIADELWQRGITAAPRISRRRSH